MCLSSQQTSQKKSVLYWADVGLGFCSYTLAVKDIGFNMQNGTMFYTLQISRIDSSGLLLGAPEREKIFIVIDALLGVAIQNANWHASISCGLSYIRRTITTNLFSHTGDPFDLFPSIIEEVKDIASALGFVVETQLFWNKGSRLCPSCGKYLGAGLKLFINANKLETITRFTFNVMFGKLRQCSNLHFKHALNETQ